MMLPERYQEMCKGFEAVRSAREGRDQPKADDPGGPHKEDFWSGKKLPEMAHPQIEVLGDIALARVHGVTGKGLSALAMSCGGFDTGLFRQQLKNVAEDPAIKTLVIDFNSPGGMAAGNAQAADSIRAVADSGKRVIGYTSAMCASAAYWMACACDELHAEADSLVGSISTITAGVDSSERWAKEGLVLKLFATGKFKATGMPGKKWTAEEEANIWERINKLDAEFKGFVRARRGLSDEEMQGQWWYAKHAPKRVVDSTDFESLEELLEVVMAMR
jgi:signal peptide peptidase SppA